MEISETDSGVTFAVRLNPRSSRDAFESEYAGALKIRVTAPPIEDRANEALRRLLAESLNVPYTAVRIVSGEKSRNKRIEILGVTRGQIAALMRRPKELKQSLSPKRKG
jgi:uncharacterized protein (TIGR00251 family)